MDRLELALFGLSNEALLSVRLYEEYLNKPYSTHVVFPDGHLNTVPWAYGSVPEPPNFSRYRLSL